MWWISRCISIDSLNSCFQQQKNRTSYDLGLSTERSSIYDRRHDDDDTEYDLSSRRPSHNRVHRPNAHGRRRIPKRYSDIVGPSNAKGLLQRQESTSRDKRQPNLPRRHSLRPIHEAIYYFESNASSSRDVDSPDHRIKTTAGTELMHSVDRNSVYGDGQSSINQSVMSRSHSFNVCTSWKERPELGSQPRLIPRVRTIDFDRVDLPLVEPAPDYDDQNDESLVIRTIPNDSSTDEEPAVDYDDSKSTDGSDTDAKSLSPTELAVSASFIIAQTSTSATDETTSTPPAPPPLPTLPANAKKTTFRCRTIADKLSADHKLILKDNVEEKPAEPPMPIAKPQYFHVTRNNQLRNISQSLSRSSPSSPTALPEYEADATTTACANPCLTDEQVRLCLSSSSPGTSSIQENDYEPHSSSSKIYNEYKKRASLTSSIPTNTVGSHSMIIHPMHTRIGLRSSTSSSSTNEKLTDMTLSGKQMNVCVINQLNEHLSTRFPKLEQQQQQQSCPDNKDHLTYDPPPELMRENLLPPNVYDEPNAAVAVDPDCSYSKLPPPAPPLPPPPPPPLPAGGFRLIKPATDRSSQAHRLSAMILPRDGASSTVPGSAGTSTISSNLSDTRILSELRENPLFTRAKQHLEIEPGSNGRRSGRRLIGSTANLAHPDASSVKETVSYLRLDRCSQVLTKPPTVVEPANVKEPLETIIMHTDELDALIGKRTKSSSDMQAVKTRSSTKSLIQTQRRQSELELIFQKRAQRSEHNLT